MKIVCVGYRKWALEIYERLKIFYGTSHDIVIFDKDNYSETSLTQENPDMVLFYGWSWKISPSIIEKYMCLMLHPSPLPKYRGGSPIQNQIINGETQSAVTIIEMTDKLDAGDILAQESISLDGNIKEILKRLTRVGTRLTKRIVSGNIAKRKQESKKKMNTDE